VILTSLPTKHWGSKARAFLSEKEVRGSDFEITSGSTGALRFELKK